MSGERVSAPQCSGKVCFDYTEFLAASCKKHWSFVDAIYGVMPIFGMVVKSQTELGRTPQAQLTALALQVLSTQLNDETNIIRLIKLAKQRGITVLDIQLPYPLEAAQLRTIKQKFPAEMALSQKDECLSVNLSQMPND
ncbi:MULTISPECIES: hypothetical protein [Yersinia pseudotuberculosis complex]|uniref:Uncharacterized protein n=1 Tax=Yersinia pseudotuberculosis serotype O:1b (strain IP 31758) TaxID=349747 RepID=A0A0U1QW47_YERP3|nr:MULTISPECIES: hypothetical protein [Yersinia pseudotuberculosis complex]ABS46776.1 conserved hypothetical protein [Yersinia pseudotuberculosis IP 31758]AJK17031.1 hypothetical protein BZ19_1587 [Yersinia pseudotuberculosis str. PA3606]MCE4110778.1 hypothetical protein [Yersinia pseudotuberculosis]MCF1162089.1 hypothetical protein [Yersinia pseudotuberculosis]RYC26698.1 hypothetical protein EU971_08545 [Yersinia pseudotuberculosis]